MLLLPTGDRMWDTQIPQPLRGHRRKGEDAVGQRRSAAVAHAKVAQAWIPTWSIEAEQHPPPHSFLPLPPPDTRIPTTHTPRHALRIAPPRRSCILGSPHRRQDAPLFPADRHQAPPHRVPCKVGSWRQVEHVSSSTEEHESTHIPCEYRITHPRLFRCSTSPTHTGTTPESSGRARSLTPVWTGVHPL